MKNLFLLPTDKPILDGSINYILRCVKEFKIYNKQHKIGDILDELSWDFDSKYWKPQNIYITNDEEIKEGDWILLPSNEIYKMSSTDMIHYLESESKSTEKIILTTDEDLIKDGIQAIPGEFLEWFVKNPNCEEVEINQEFNTKNMVYGINTNPYKIIIPKEEPNWSELENSGLDKPFQLNKQETLEEAAKKLFGSLEKDGGSIYYINLSQDENKYSEEEVIKLLHKRDEHMNTYDKLHGGFQTPKEWFEQFKKK
jgi:hypothetical protein